MGAFIMYSIPLEVGLFLGLLVMAGVCCASSGDNNNSTSKPKRRENNVYEVPSTMEWKLCKKCGHKLNVVAKSCPYCSSTTFTEFHEPKPIKVEVEKPREIAHDAELLERQKELAKKYNKNNYEKLNNKCN